MTDHQNTSTNLDTWKKWYSTYQDYKTAFLGPKNRRRYRSKGFETFFYLLHYEIEAFLIRRMKKRTQQALESIAQNDPTWDPHKLKMRSIDMFLKLQKSLSNREDSVAQQHMTKKILEKIRLQNARLLSQHRYNIREKIRFEDVAIFTYDLRRNYFWITLKGTMQDYLVNDATGDYIAGHFHNRGDFHQLWRCTRTASGWQIDRIKRGHIRNLYWIRFAVFCKRVWGLLKKA